jgi:hypothetical protein
MALFGYSVAQENDSELAVRAALALQRSSAGLKEKDTRKPPLAALNTIRWRLTFNPRIRGEWIWSVKSLWQ